MHKMQVKINQLGVLFCTIFFLTSNSLSSETIPLLKSPKVENPKSVLFIGNSFFYYNNGVHKPVLGMVKANTALGKGHRFRNITINSSSLERQAVESYVTNQKIGSFSITSSYKYKKYDSYDSYHYFTILLNVRFFLTKYSQMINLFEYPFIF